MSTNLVREAFDFAWDEYGRDIPKKMTAREALLWHFARMRALSHMACTSGFGPDGLYSWDGDFITREQLETLLEREASLVLEAKKKVQKRRRVQGRA